MADRTSAKLHRVEVKGRIGRGGMADVYEGVHQSLGHTVALKVLHAHLLQDEDARRRFQAEARAVAGLRHPNIVQVYDFDLIDGRPFIVMELLDGSSLGDYLHSLHRRGGRLHHDQVVTLTSQVAKALDHAHAKGIVHRDVKPANIVLRSPSGRVDVDSPLPEDVSAVLTDFGIARVASNTSATATGTLLGTPAYMAPEQVMGKSVDARTDIYALGVVLYELLAGRPPFTSEAKSNSPAAVLFKHVHEEPPPLAVDPPQLQDVVTRALAKNPVDRYMTAGDLVRDLKRAEGGGTPEPVTLSGRPVETLRVGPMTRRARPRRRRRTWLWAVALVALALALGLGLLLGRAALTGTDLLGGDPGGPRQVDTSGGAPVGSENNGAGSATNVPAASGSGTPTTAVGLAENGSTSTPTSSESAPSATASDSPLAISTPTNTASPGGTPGPDPTATEPPGADPTDTPGPTAQPTKTPVPTATPSTTSTATNTPTPTASREPTATTRPTATSILPPIDVDLTEGP